MINSLKNKILNNGLLTKDEAFHLIQVVQNYVKSISGSYELHPLFSFFCSANEIRKKFRNNTVDLCAIINAKSGACSEDCSYCAQSSKSKTDAPVYPLISKDIILQKAKEAKDAGVKRFCIVTSGRKITDKEIGEIASMIEGIHNIGLLPCATLGLLNRDELHFLKESGLVRYHHNLETSERFFPEICRTHTYYDKLKTIEAAQSVGLSVCSGGIFGLGETWQDRIEMAFALRDLNVDSSPINFLIPVKGSLLGNMDVLHPFEALSIISLYRFILPEKEIRVCGGRIQILKDMHSFIFMAGADSLLTGNYLTTTGRSYNDDIKLIQNHGLRTD